MTSNFKRLASDSFVYGFGGLATSLISILTVPIFTRFFSPSDYGAIDVIAATVSFFTLFTIMGFNAAQNYYFFEKRNMNDRKIMLSTSFYYRLSVSILISAVIIVSHDLIAVKLMGDPVYGKYLMIAALSIPFVSGFNFFMAVQRMTYRKKEFLLLNLSYNVSRIALILIIYYVLDFKIFSVFIGNLLSNMLFFFIAYYCSRKYLSIVFKVDILKKLLMYGLPLILSSLAVWALNFTDRFFLLRLVSKSELGIYALAAKIASLIFLITNAFRIAWTPLSMDISRNKDAPVFYSQVMNIYTVGITFIVLCLSLFAREIISIVSGDTYMGSAGLVGFMGFSFLFYELIPVLGVGLFITKKVRFTNHAFITAAAVNFTLNWILIYWFGILGAAIATMTAFIVADCLVYWFAQRYYSIPFDVNKLIVFLIIALTINIVFYNIHISNIIVSISIKIIVLSLFGVLVHSLKLAGFKDLLNFVRDIQKKIRSSLINSLV